MEGVFGVLVWVLLLGVYFLPAIVAQKRKKDNVNSIVIVNLFLGWTLLGWVIALAWALAVDKK